MPKGSDGIVRVVKCATTFKPLLAKHVRNEHWFARTKNRERSAFLPSPLPSLYYCSAFRSDSPKVSFFRLLCMRQTDYPQQNSSEFNLILSRLKDLGGEFIIKGNKKLAQKQPNNVVMQAVKFGIRVVYTRKHVMC